MTHEQLTMARADFIAILADQFQTRGFADHVAASYAHGIVEDLETGDVRPIPGP